MFAIAFQGTLPAPLRFLFTLPAAVCVTAMLLLALLGTNSRPAFAALTPVEFAAFGQSTYVWQYKPGLAARYSGPNSLGAAPEHSYSATATAYFGWRLGKGTEVFLNPEAARGIPLSRLAGLGGLSNGELARTSGSAWTFYRARAFLRQTWNVDGHMDSVPAEANRMAGMLASRRWVLTLGNFSALDVFDDNGLAKDPRTDFLNWALMTYGAWDYPADSRGYSWGAALEYLHDGWSVRAGRFLMPQESNGLRLNRRVFASFGDVMEVERSHVWRGLEGHLRVLAFRNRARMGNFDQAIEAGRESRRPPDLGEARGATDKWGLGLSFEQQLDSSASVFMRFSQNDGRSETFAFTEIDRSLSGGMTINGGRWNRSHDRIGLAFAHNGLSRTHRNFLAAGGLGYFLGDGALRYRHEMLAEAFYRWQLDPRLELTLNAQWIRNPGYNADRGPARTLGVRAHLHF